MPTGGGIFTIQNKILPGAYINFVALGSVPKVGARGIAALPLELDWGPENQAFALEAAEFNQVAMKVLGYDPMAAELLLIREALKRAKTLLVYRVNSGGQKASVSVGGMTVTATWGGTRGNDLSVAIQCGRYRQRGRCDVSGRRSCGHADSGQVCRSRRPEGK